jgi:hypothetical protein
VGAKIVFQADSLIRFHAVKVCVEDRGLGRKDLEEVVSGRSNGFFNAEGL